MSDEISMKFEEELFNHCKSNETDTKATSGILLKVIILLIKPLFVCLRVTFFPIKMANFECAV